MGRDGRMGAGTWHKHGPHGTGVRNSNRAPGHTCLHGVSLPAVTQTSRLRIIISLQ